MTYVKWGLIAAIISIVAAFFHYSLPSRDIVRIVGTEVRLVEEARTDSQGNTVPFQDDVFFIKTVEKDGSPRVYRNEDNLWYLKFDSGNLDTQASNMVSTSSEPKWMVVTHYGWRITFLSMYPNAISMREAEGPDESLTPWFNIIFIIILILTVLVIRRALIILRERHVDPVVEALDEEFDETVGWWRRKWRGLVGGK